MCKAIKTSSKTWRGMTVHSGENLFLDLSAQKNEELIIDFRRDPTSRKELAINDDSQTCVPRYNNWLETYFQCKYSFFNKWEMPTETVFSVKTEIPRLSFHVLRTFYGCYLESTLTFGFLAWHSGLSVTNQNILSCVIRLSSKEIGEELNSVDDLWTAKRRGRQISLNSISVSFVILNIKWVSTNTLWCLCNDVVCCLTVGKYYYLTCQLTKHLTRQWIAFVVNITPIKIVFSCRFQFFSDFPFATLYEGIFLQRSYAEAYVNMFLKRLNFFEDAGNFEENLSDARHLGEDTAWHHKPMYCLEKCKSKTLITLGDTLSWISSFLDLYHLKKY